ncbi:MAG: flagellar brake protein [Betaproteobacteria bacterium]|nr:flagellar brake protein [Betaproteobacteria bacterium]
MEKETEATGVLVRSRIEIARMLEEIRRANKPITADLDGGEQIFISRLLLVERSEGYLLVEYSTSKSANASVLALDSVAFHCYESAASIEFPARTPQETQYEGRPAIRLLFPEALVRVHCRAHSRIKVPQSVSLRCIVDSAGAVPFEARVTDVSPGGIGSIVYDTHVHLEPGIHLPRSKIIFPNGRAVLADLEVRHVRTIAQQDGTSALRAGCRFVTATRDLKRLIGVFVSEIAAQANEG